MPQQQDPENVQPDGKQGDGERTFTQQEIDAIVADRLARERQKYADYGDLQQKAAKLAELEEAQKSELQKAQEAETKARLEAQKAMEKANHRLVQAEFISVASRYGVAHPEDAFSLADRSLVQVDDDGRIDGVEQAVKTLVEAGRLPMTGRPQAANLNGGAGNHERPADKAKALTAEESAMARKLGLTDEEYQKAKNKE